MLVKDGRPGRETLQVIAWFGGIVGVEQLHMPIYAAAEQMTTCLMRFWRTSRYIALAIRVDNGNRPSQRQWRDKSPPV